MQITILRYAVNMRIGVTEEERQRPQLVWFDMSINIDSSSFQTEKLATTVDYSKVANLIDTFYEGSEAQLLESVCQGCGELLLKSFDLIESIDVTVEKSTFPGEVMKSARVKVMDQFRRTQ